jgi:molybdate transport system substrate-binding protein
MVLRAICTFLAAAAAGAALAGEVQVAAAANFAAPLGPLGTAFTVATGHVLKVTSGATGKFRSQIAAGAPFDVLLAADDETPKQLVTDGLAVAGSTFTYAIGRLVLWSTQPALVDDQGMVLGATGRFEHLAIANPKLAPYGAAAMQVLRARGLADTLAGKLVTGESIAQTYQFIATGNAELGFVALSQVAAPGRPVVGSSWLVPAALHAPIRQDAVLLKTGMSNPAAAAFLAWLKSDSATTMIRAWGYER